MDRWEAPARAALKDVFGHDDFRGQQHAAVAAAMAGQDALVLMPTGGGKTLCYALPAVIGCGLVVVVSPLIALMQDQVAGMQEKGLQAALLSSTLTSQQRQHVLQRLKELGSSSGGGGSGSPPLQLLYVTPELVDASGSFLHDLQRLAAARHLQLVAVDEAHCISSYGHDFRPAYRKLGALKQTLPAVPIMALTATASQQVQRDILLSLKLQHAVTLVTSFNRPNIEYGVRLLDLEQQQRQQQQRLGAAGEGAEDGDAEVQGDHDALGVPCLLELLAAHLPALHPRRRQAPAPPGGHGPAGSCIVYALARSTVDFLARRLTAAGVAGVAAYHAALPAATRAQVLQRWRAGTVQLVVATVAFSMGVDKPDVELVVHYNLPRSVESFYQESGRAGRDGRPATSVLLYSLADKRRLQYILGKDAEERRARKRKRAGAAPTGAADPAAAAAAAAAAAPAAGALQQLSSFSGVVEYATKPGCKRAKLLAHFGEAAPQAAAAGAGGCAGGSCCDWCADPSAARLAVEELQQLEAAAALQRGRGWRRGLRVHPGAREHPSGAAAPGSGGSSGEGEGGSSGGGDDDDDDAELDLDAAHQQVTAALAAAHATSSGGGGGGGRGAAYYAALEAAEARQDRQQQQQSEGEADPVLRRLQQAAEQQQQQQVAGVDEGLREDRRQKLAALIAGNASLAAAGTPCTAEQAAAVACAVEGALHRPGMSGAQYRAQLLAAARQVRAASSWLQLLPRVDPSAPATDEGACAVLLLAVGELERAAAAAPAAALAALQRLEGFPVTLELLQRTQVAPRVRALKKSHPQLAAAAAAVVQAWKQRVVQLQR